jgi:hypothetical protein
VPVQLSHLDTAACLIDSDTVYHKFSKCKQHCPCRAVQSNTWSGAESFSNANLHHIQAGQMNPYQSAISIIGNTLAVFDDDNLIPW